jgi:hypothetical protein
MLKPKTCTNKDFPAFFSNDLEMIAAANLSVCGLNCQLRPNSWTKCRQKSQEFSSLLFTVASQVRFALRFLFLQTHETLTVSTVQLLYSVKEKGGKPD